MLENILEKIKEYDTIIIHRHMRPDGDCIGCQFGLKYFLQHNFPEKHIYAVGDKIPEYLSFVGSNDSDTPDIYGNALVFVLDTSTKNRICLDSYDKGAFLIKIDHHDDSEPFGDIEYVDEKSPACAQIITNMIASWNLELTEDAAIALYTGLVSDTGRFKFRGVDSKTFDAAGYLSDKITDIPKIYELLELKDLNTYILQAYLYKHMKHTPNGCMYIYFTKRVCDKFGVSREDAAALVSCMASIKGYPVWITFVDYPDNIRVRIRSRNIAINNVAKNWRGGGHLQAAGATLYNKKEIKLLLKDIDKCIENYKKDHQEVI